MTREDETPDQETPSVVEAESGLSGVEPLAARRLMSARDMIGVAIQGGVVFLAVSILLGRAYFLSFYSQLGIPPSDIDMTTLEYSIASPDVTRHNSLSR